MKIIYTDELTPNSLKSETEKLWVYNGLDCGVTREVLDAIKPDLDNQTRATYEFRKELMGPVLEMGLRGIMVDTRKRDMVLEQYHHDLRHLESNLFLIMRDGYEYHLANWNSREQVMAFVYGHLGLPTIKKRNNKGQYVPTVNREALEKLATNYFVIQPFVNHVLLMRDIKKKIGVLRTEIDPDGRMRTSYNIAGTETGRFSSSLSEFGTGTNLQNIEDLLRSPFVADPGNKLAYIDLEQAESRVCGAIHWNLFHDSTYLDACESGDLHTSVCKLAWPNFGWTGNLNHDKELAEGTKFYRQHSYRHMAKVLGHGSNYRGRPPTMSVHTKIPEGVIKDFQLAYFKAFPAFSRWHDWVAAELYQFGKMTTMLGMRRHFFGRRNDDKTIREAIAYEPQSTVGELLNKGMLAVWRLRICELMLQIHDAIVIQYPEEQEDEIIPQVTKAITIPIELRHDRTLIIPCDVKTGWNWGSFVPELDKEGKPNKHPNPNGLKKYSPGDTRKREETPSILDRQLL